jgi:hypothetical protein
MSIFLAGLAVGLLIGMSIAVGWKLIPIPSAWAKKSQKGGS